MSLNNVLTTPKDNPYSLSRELRIKNTKVCYFDEEAQIRVLGLNHGDAQQNKPEISD